MRHLFVTVHETAFGEVLQGVRLAGELVAAGDQVFYLAPAAVRPALAGAPVKVGTIDLVVRALDQVLAPAVAETRADVVCLVDALWTFTAFHVRGLDAGAIVRLPVPVVALDVWDLARTGLVVDSAAGTFELDARALALPRVVPVPFAHPGAAGAYRALPAVNARARAARRAALGLRDGERAILFPTAMWQHREAALAATRPLAESVPPLLYDYVRELGDVRLVHVGPWRLPGADALGDRYIYHPPAPRAVFEELVAAADLLLTLNAAATTISTAIAARLPVLLAVHDRVPAAPGPLVARFLAGAPPLRPLRAWPGGMAAFIGRTLADNPYLDAVTTVELLDETALLSAARALLFDPAAADEARGRQERYAALVAALPTGRDRYVEAARTARSASS
jgi:hypothetical protein